MHTYMDFKCIWYNLNTPYDLLSQGHSVEKESGSLFSPLRSLKWRKIDPPVYFEKVSARHTYMDYKCLWYNLNTPYDLWSQGHSV